MHECGLMIWSDVRSRPSLEGALTLMIPDADDAFVDCTKSILGPDIVRFDAVARPCVQFGPR